MNLKEYVNKGDLIVKLKGTNIIAPFSGVLGYRGITEDILGSDSSIIITLDDSSIIYSDTPKLLVYDHYNHTFESNNTRDVRFYNRFHMEYTIHFHISSSRYSNE